MNATVVLPPHNVPPVPDDLPIAFDAPANDAAPAGRPGPEAPLLVSFVGLSAQEAERALRAFPGGRRIVLAAP